MALSWIHKIFNQDTTNTEADIPYSVVESGNAFRGGSYVVYGMKPYAAWAMETCASNVVNPSETITPSPPVYPIVYHSDVVYGREHFSEGLKMYRGDTYQRAFLVIEDGQSYDLTNKDIRMTFKWELSDADNDAVITKTLDNDGITINNYAGGEFQLNIEPADTSSLPAYRVDLWYDAQITDENGKVYTVAYGRFTILPDSSITTP